MNFQHNLLSKLFFIFVLFLFNTAFASQVLFVYRDFGHKGDENQVRGVIRAYAKVVNDLEVEEFNIGQEEQLKSSVKRAIESKEKKPIILGVGEKTVASFADLLPFEEATTIHLCHMVTANHPNLPGKVDFIALPLHSLGSFEDTVAHTNTQLIRTVGVSHNRQIEEICRSYDENKDNLPPRDSYLGIILAGDAPTPDNEILVFSETNARELARYVANILEDKHLLVINGPRTGKYDPKTLTEKKEAHRDGQKDFITQAFLDELIQSNIPENQLSLFDFQFGVSTSQDMDLLLGTVRATNSNILVPGESTSSISECIDVLPAGAVVVYHNTAMNAVHNAHVQSELQVGRIKFLQAGFQETCEQKNHNQDITPHFSASETIAAALSQAN